MWKVIDFVGKIIKIMHASFLRIVDQSQSLLTDKILLCSNSKSEEEYVGGYVYSNITDFMERLCLLILYQGISSNHLRYSII